MAGHNILGLLLFSLGASALALPADNAPLATITSSFSLAAPPPSATPSLQIQEKARVVTVPTSTTAVEEAAVTASEKPASFKSLAATSSGNPPQDKALCSSSTGLSISSSMISSTDIISHFCDDENTVSVTNVLTGDKITHIEEAPISYGQWNYNNTYVLGSSGDSDVEHRRAVMLSISWENKCSSSKELRSITCKRAFTKVVQGCSADIFTGGDITGEDCVKYSIGISKVGAKVPKAVRPVKPTPVMARMAATVE